MPWKSERCEMPRSARRDRHHRCHALSGSACATMKLLWKSGANMALLNSSKCKREYIVMAVMILAAAMQAQDTPPASTSSAPATLTLQDALSRARANEPQYRAALTQYGVARGQTVAARAGLLPNVNYNAEFLYT